MSSNIFNGYIFKENPSLLSQLNEKTIEFKNVDLDVFAKNRYNTTKVSLEKNSQYLTSEITKNLDPKVSNTVLLNLPTGSGKTTSVYDMIKNHFNQEDSLFIIASPFIVLCQKDILYLKNLGIPSSDIEFYQDAESQTHL